jgi:hypothetical protein
MAEPIQPTEPAAAETVRAAETAVLPRVELVETKPARKRRRWLGWVIAAAVLVILLVVGFFVGDSYARQYAKDYVREQIIQVLALPKDTPVDVELGSGSVILQALSGSIREVTVGIDTLTVGPITGSARLVATDVPLDAAAPLSTLGIVVTIPENEVRKLAGNFSGLELKSIDVGDGVIAVGTEVNILGFLIIPIGIDLAPAAVEGGISFDPQVIRVGKDEISVADLRASPEFSAIAGDLLRSQDFCVASSLPRALTITDVAVSGSSLVVTLSGDGAVLGGEEMSTMGECPRK